MDDVKINDSLWTGSFIAACLGNFLLFFSFYLLLPLLPLFLFDTFHSDPTTIGAALASYTIAALIMRPFSGFLLDHFQRKSIYLWSYAIFMVVFIGYAHIHFLALFVLLRVLHGAAFGMVSTAGNTLVIDIMPSSRRGEGLGYYGIANNIAMAIGPMITLFLHQTMSYSFTFYFAFGVALLGYIIVNLIKFPDKQVTTPETDERAHPLDRFFLIKGTRAGVALLLMAAPYGITTSFVALYGEQLGFDDIMGYFFSLMAVGLIIARLFSGKMVDRNKLITVVLLGSLIGALSFLLLAITHYLPSTNYTLRLSVFMLAATLVGLGYGMLFPAYNTLFVNLGYNNQRATASSSYLTSWDVGIGIGLITGGAIANTIGGLPLAFGIGTVVCLLSTLYVATIVGKHYETHRVR